MTCRKIILGHLNFCPKIYIMINLRTLSVNRAPGLTQPEKVSCAVMTASWTFLQM